MEFITSMLMAGLALSAPPAAPAPAMSAAECAVWQREASFARSVEQHDHAAFAEHVHPQAVFQAASRAPLRGRAAIAQDWAPIVDGKERELRWRPGFVSIGGDPDIALSAGPAWMSDTGPDGQPRLMLGGYVSTWVRDADGAWRVLFDRGGAPMRPATQAEIDAAIAAVPAACP